MEVGRVGSWVPSLDPVAGRFAGGQFGPPVRGFVPGTHLCAGQQRISISTVGSRLHRAAIARLA